MIGLPQDGDRVRIFPFPGRTVQHGPVPAAISIANPLGGIRWLPATGEVVIWSPFYLEQLRSGDILLHAPPGVEVPEDAEKADFEPAKAAAKLTAELDKEAEEKATKAKASAKKASKR